MKRKGSFVLIIVIALIAALVIVGYEMAKRYLNLPVGDGETETTVPEDVADSAVKFADKEDINDVHLRDKSSLYEDDDPFDVETMYLTVSYGNATEGTNHTWAEINEYSAYYYDEKGIDRYKVAALLQVGDEKGPKEGELGYGRTAPNACVQIRGQTSSRNAQKNYKIKLNDDSAGWRGQKTIALNKHQTDGLRFRNKLMYDLMIDVPQIMGLRTQFVHLYVRDKTGDNPDEFVDYGLFTQVEQLNKTALKAHGLDKNGFLYKINYFEFLEDDAIVTVDDPNYDEKEFNKRMETKGRADHERLIEMIHDVNDYSLTPDEVLDKWFDRENIAYWMAFMTLMGNSDVQSRNLYIYSYLNGQKWYLYPWDNDVAVRNEENRIHDYHDFEDWQDGVTNYWGNMIFRRALLSSSFREELTAAVEDLYNNALNPEKVGEAAKKYAEVVMPYAYSMPDKKNEGVKQEDEYRQIVDAIPEEIEYNYDRYYASLASPMPFYVGVPEVQKDGKTLKLLWDAATCFEESEITYDVWLSTDPNGGEKLMEESGLIFPTTTYKGLLKPGEYYLHVSATNQLGYNTNCFDYYSLSNGGVIYGVFPFIVEEDGTISAVDHEE